MNKELLDKLLMSFYDGETTMEEEKQLMDFFTTATSLDEEYLADKELFLALNQNTELADIPSSLDEKLDTWFVSECESVREETIPQQKPSSVLHRYKYILSMAASLLLLLGGWYVFKSVQHEQKPSLVAVELSLEESTELTEQVLFLLSSKLNQSVGAVDLAQTKVNDVSRVMHKLKMK